MTHLVRYAILGANEDAEDIGYAQIHDDEQWAATVARRLTKRQAKPVTASDALLDAPYRVATLRIEVIDPKETEADDGLHD